MARNIAARFALSTLFAVIACARVSAQAPAPPSIAFNYTNGAIVHQSAGVIPVTITVSDPVGVRLATISGGYSSSSGNYLNPPTRATLTLYFYVGYFPTGPYIFNATAYDTALRYTASAITLTLAP